MSLISLGNKGGADMSCGELFSLIIGAGIGLVSSICILVIERLLDRRGKLSIYYKFTAQKKFGDSWGFYDHGDGTISLIIPVLFEIQNTSNSTRVVRDVGLYLYNDETKLFKMVQLDYFHFTERKGGEIVNEENVYFGGEKGSYSFVISPRSISRFECEYMQKVNKNEINQKQFNNIILQYLDEKDKAKKYVIKHLNGDWNKKKMNSDEDWLLLK